MKPTRLLLSLATSALLVSCAWGPVLTPYAVGQAERAGPAEVATVWGVRQGATLYFTHVNGESLPSRGGGGYPVSLTLPPGQHTLRIYLVTPDHRSTEQSVKANLQAGHTYVMEYLGIPGTNAFLLKLADQGPSQVCAYTSVEQLRTALQLQCRPRPGT